LCCSGRPRVPAVRTVPKENVDNATKQCRQCGDYKALDNFHRNSASPDGHGSCCRKCKKEQDRARNQGIKIHGRDGYRDILRRERSARTKNNIRERHLKSKYGLTLRQYNEILLAQNGACASCGEPPGSVRAQGRWLTVDHDHSCCPGVKTCGNCVRGLLCSKCNMSLGYAADNPEILLNLARYLIEARAEQSTSPILGAVG
jgi:hypothetical protein